MRIDAPRGLTEAQCAAARQLHALCCEPEGLRGELYLSA